MTPLSLTWRPVSTESRNLVVEFYKGLKEGSTALVLGRLLLSVERQHSSMDIRVFD
jgi:hypothetical protein